MQPGLLSSPEVVAWLGGREPAWTLLTFDSWRALNRKPDEPDAALAISDNITSPLAENALAFLSRIGEGMRLTATVNLTRAVVADMLDATTWPGFDPAEAFILHKVVNEPDFLPLHALRIFCERAKLTRIQGGQLRLTRTAKALLAKRELGRLNRILFEAAFWNTNLAYFDGLPLAPWPQGDIGTALWCLSVAASNWQTPDDLVRLCTIPVKGVLTAGHDDSGWMFEARILCPLGWFGLLEVEETPDEEMRFLKHRRYGNSTCCAARARPTTNLGWTTRTLRTIRLLMPCWHIQF